MVFPFMLMGPQPALYHTHTHAHTHTLHVSSSKGMEVQVITIILTHTVRKCVLLDDTNLAYMY